MKYSKTGVFILDLLKFHSLCSHAHLGCETPIHGDIFSCACFHVDHFSKNNTSTENLIYENLAVENFLLFKMRYHLGPT